jgi:hypothetical protein
MMIFILPLSVAVGLLKNVVLAAQTHDAVFEVKLPLVARSVYLWEGEMVIDGICS